MKAKRIIEIYGRRYKENLIKDMEFYKCLNGIKEAIEYAGMARNHKNKTHSHQRRVGKNKLKRLKEELLKHMGEIEKCQDFEELINTVEKYTKNIEGIGKLTIYDTSLRIGFFLGIYPKKIYLHAGTRKGALHLLGKEKIKGRKFLLKEELPKEFRELEPYEIEDILCIFKDKFKDLKSKDIKNM